MFPHLWLISKSIKREMAEWGAVAQGIKLGLSTAWLLRMAMLMEDPTGGLRRKEQVTLLEALSSMSLAVLEVKLSPIYPNASTLLKLMRTLK